MIWTLETKGSKDGHGRRNKGSESFLFFPWARRNGKASGAGQHEGIRGKE